jgi:hypothetical protein
MWRWGLLRSVEKTLTPDKLIGAPVWVLMSNVFTSSNLGARLRDMSEESVNWNYSSSTVSLCTMKCVASCPSLSSRNLSTIASGTELRLWAKDNIRPLVLLCLWCPSVQPNLRQPICKGGLPGGTLSLRIVIKKGSSTTTKTGGKFGTFICCSSRDNPISARVWAHCLSAGLLLVLINRT